MAGDRNIFLATQHDATIDEPNPEQIYQIGTLGRILQAQRQENGQIKVVVEGRERGQSVSVEIDSEVADGPYSVILEQVSNGVAVRMAVLYLLAGRDSAEPIEA